MGCELRVVNVGLELFAETLEELGVPVVQVDWRPPAAGDQRLADLLSRLQKASGQGPG
ncbi:MAG: fdrA domain protein [Chloroflexi bacterium]|nr:fdrA domain protein [Chloroflexota bacterium]